MRVLGLDFGSKTCGVAISDPFGWTAQGVETIVRKEENKLRRTLARIDELVKEYRVETIVLGLPLNMDDTMGPRAEATLLFKEQVERRSGIPVVLWDERCTTVMAHAALNVTDTRGKKRKEKVDAVAAVMILESYLAYRKNQK